MSEGFIRVKNWERRPIATRVRERVQDRFINCFYCGRTPTRSRRGWNAVRLEVDHVEPVCSGGSNDEANLVMACESCNRSKQGKPMVEFVRYCVDENRFWFQVGC